MAATQRWNLRPRLGPPFQARTPPRRRLWAAQRSWRSAARAGPRSVSTLVKRSRPRRHGRTMALASPGSPAIPSAACAPPPRSSPWPSPSLAPRPSRASSHEPTRARPGQATGAPRHRYVPSAPWLTAKLGKRHSFEACQTTFRPISLLFLSRTFCTCTLNCRAAGANRM